MGHGVPFQGQESVFQQEAIDVEATVDGPKTVVRHDKQSRPPIQHPHPVTHYLVHGLVAAQEQWAQPAGLVVIVPGMGLVENAPEMVLNGIESLDDVDEEIKRAACQET